MQRLNNWEQLLAEFIAKNKNTSFQWGVFDCCLFACDAVLTITGVDMAQDFRGKYTTAKEAYEFVKNFAGDGLAELVAKRAQELGITEIKPLLAQRGDVVLVNKDGHDSLGIVGLDGRFALCAAIKGLTQVLVKDCRKAYRI